MTAYAFWPLRGQKRLPPQLRWGGSYSSLSSVIGRRRMRFHSFGNLSKTEQGLTEGAQWPRGGDDDVDCTLTTCRKHQTASAQIGVTSAMCGRTKTNSTCPTQ